MDLTHSVHSRARAPQGLRASLKGVACSIAIVIGIAMSMTSVSRSEAQIMPFNSLNSLAKYQLTHKQYKCHNEIVYRESSWNINAVNGTHWGYYQMHNRNVKGKPYDYQFEMYWYYVSYRYGLDNEIPDYCKALKHLRTRGWQ
jgi:hypothetical protein